MTACLLLVSCKKQNTDLSKVETFIEMLKANKSDRFEPNDFISDDISELLNYINEQERISNFPRNPLSSFYVEEVPLGLYVLWTIESIRLDEIDDPEFFLFASLNPRIARSNTAAEIDQNAILPNVAAAYDEWWNSKLSLEEKLEINPLAELDLIWN